jgi:hypothetical protein
MAKSVMAVKPDVISSLKDGAYKQALANDRLESVARYCIDNIAGFKSLPIEVPAEAKEQLYDGYRLRFNENNPPVTYARVNDHYLLIDGSNPELNDAPEKSIIGVDFAFSFTQQQFGKMKTDNPYLYPIIKDIRDTVNTYCSNRLGDLKRKVKAVLNEGKPRERSATSDFDNRVKEMFSDLVTKCKNAKARGDDTADEAKLSKSKIAFMAVWNHQD